MKDMSNRDKMILIIITIIIILVAGFFALIRPAYDNYVADSEAYETTKAEYDGIQQKLNAIPDLEKGITEVYESAKKTAEIFVNDAFQTVNDGYDNKLLDYNIDEYLQPALDESNLVVNSMANSGLGTGTLTYYYYTPNVVTYSLLEAADINANPDAGKKGHYEKEIEELLMTDTVLSAKEEVEMLTNAVELTVTGKKENLMSFLETIKNDENAILVDSISIADYQFVGGQGGSTTQTQIDADGNEVQVTVENTVTPGTGTSQMTLNVTFYNAKEIDAPDFGE